MKSVARFSSDIELKNYVNEAKLNGLSLTDVEKLVVTQGASISELEKLRKLWNGIATETSFSNNDSNSIVESSFGNESVDDEIKMDMIYPKDLEVTFFKTKT